MQSRPSRNSGHNSGNTPRLESTDFANVLCVTAAGGQSVALYTLRFLASICVALLCHVSTYRHLQNESSRKAGRGRLFQNTLLYAKTFRRTRDEISAKVCGSWDVLSISGDHDGRRKRWVRKIHNGAKGLQPSHARAQARVLSRPLSLRSLHPPDCLAHMCISEAEAKLRS